ncbi:MAG: NAD-dependent epimerase/dehydratase family protein [Chloroflexi bacterium AL-W]|nr:NAD-dependent epimerase/dehydratase family protein [Chloroflexi bacterium AL-N1]NOK69261.1 NAD-dependent epimerase/dehydratase family protein [Chloroflexi bacterium AL-N10]NOK76322.1 NAD-dependent epimerase/dehydratase family protein [Chloroflexi bacterium AL-N5]NOK83439.1 NAD-dependent epimerase/dehydratase family protein [Chloroflexi bacterium AL-W]NOK91099.1 NAD-dependent epimerase/dehydratase family protein [Chloroflexi bacterium AL-N15]
MTDTELHTIFGAGPVGLAVMDVLVQQGRRVRLVSRSGQRRIDIPPEVEIVAGDAMNPADTRRFCAGAVRVYNCTNAPDYHKWPEQFPQLQRGVLAGAAATGAKLVVIENLYMYGTTHGQPIHENLPHNAKGARGQTRMRMARELMDAHQGGQVSVVVGRASDFFGPRVVQSAMGQQAFVAALNGKRAQVLLHADYPHTYSYIPDIGRALVTLGDSASAYGQVWHIPSAETLTPRAFLQIVYEEARHPLRIQVVPRLMVKALSYFVPPMRGIEELDYEFVEPFVVDASKFVTTFGNLSTSLREAIQTTLAWYKTHKEQH